MIVAHVVKSSVRDVKREFRRYDRKVNQAAVRASNKAAAKTRTYSSKLIRQDANITAANVKRAQALKKARPAATTAVLITKYRPLPAVLYKGWHASRRLRGRNVRQTATRSTFSKSKRSRGGGGVTVRFHPRKAPIKFRSGFVAVVRAGKSGRHMGLFIRKTKKSLPIKEIMGPSMLGVFEQNRGKVIRFGQNTLFDIYEKQLAYEFRK